jgi:hypothetical protein
LAPSLRRAWLSPLLSLAVALLAIASMQALTPEAEATPPTFNGQWMQPLDTLPAPSSGFLANNCGHPGYGTYVSGEYHIANDYPKAANTPVFSIGTGVVVAVQTNWPGSAVFVKYRSVDGTSFLAVYGHINSSAAAGTNIGIGGQLGTVYNWGTNSHLHFGIRAAIAPAAKDNGSRPCSAWPSPNGYVNPLPYLSAHPRIYPSTTPPTPTPSPPQAGPGVGQNAVHMGSQLNPGESLFANQYLASGNLQYAFMMQGDGNAVLYGADDGLGYRPRWHTNTNSSGANRLYMQTDGNLMLLRPDGSVVWMTSTWGHPGAFFVVQSDGNVVLYDSDGTTPLWHPGKGGELSYSYFGSDRLNAGQQLNVGEYLRSSDGRYALLLQGDSNLVLYSAGYHVIWYSNTEGEGVTRLLMQADGNLMLLRADGSVAWMTQMWGHPDAYAILQSDGNFVEYASDNSVLWHGGTGGQI